jgi:hypothetical protein
MLARNREERRSVRRFTRRGATVSLGAEKPSVDCIVWPGVTSTEQAP